MNDRDIEDTRQPKDEPEAILCEECGQEKEILDDFDGQKYAECVNVFCPQHYDGRAKEMAEKLVETLDTVSRLEKRVKFLAHKVGALEFHRDEKE